MSIFIKRAASSSISNLRPLFQTFQVSSRQFSTGPLPPLGNNLATSLITLNLAKKTNNFENTGKQPLFGRLTVGIAVCAIVSWIASWFFDTRKDTSSSTFSEVKSTEKSSSSEQADLDAIAEKQGAMWECIGRTPDEFGGYIYHYKLRKEFDIDTLKLNGYDHTPDARGKTELDRMKKAIKKKLAEIGPAVEPTRIKELLKLASKYMHQELGYHFKHDSNGLYLDLADDVAFEARFEKLRETRPDLKPLKLFSSDGAADALTFIVAYLFYDVLLSSNKEFVHDHIAHLAPTTHLMISSPEYDAARSRAREIISAYVRRFMIVEKEDRNDLQSQLPQTMTVIGVFVDGLWANRKIEQFQDFTDLLFDYPTMLGMIDNTEKYHEYWQKQFGEKFDRDALANHWKKLSSLETQYDFEHKWRAYSHFE